MNETNFDAIAARKRIDEAAFVLKSLGFPAAQQNERSALSLLALLHLSPGTSWIESSAPLRGVTQMMDFFAEIYGRQYKPNTRESVRRQTVHQFLEAGLIIILTAKDFWDLTKIDSVKTLKYSPEMLCQTPSILLIRK